MPVPSQPRLDLETVEIRPFSTATVVNRFCCGRKPIDRFLKNKARKADRRFENRTFCAHIGTSNIAIGYYSLQIGADSVADLPDGNETYLKNYVAFPAVHLNFLGVHEAFQRQGLGEYLLMDVFTKVARISDYAGFYALTLQSLDDDSTAFYTSLGFAVYSENLRQPKMLYPLAGILPRTRWLTIGSLQLSPDTAVEWPQLRQASRHSLSAARTSGKSRQRLITVSAPASVSRSA